MLRNLRQLLVVRPTAGFVPTRNGQLDALLRPPAAAPQQHTPTLTDARSTTWAPASSRRVGAVETLAGAGVMAYFAYGLAAALGLF